jgi:FkbM family methyltransferase
MLRSRLAEGALLGVLRSTGYQVASHLPEEWVRWVRSRNLIKDVLSRLSINCVFDVGANRGQFGTLLRRTGYKGLILSFEPVRVNFDALEKVAAESKNRRVFPYALGAAECSKRINVTDETVFSSFLTPSEDSQPRFPGNRVARTEEVEVRRMDSVFDDLIEEIPSPRVYVKLDTQGFDTEVLRGAESVLDRVLALQTEISFQPIYNDMCGFASSITEFQARGFEVVDFTPVVRGADQFSATEMDCVMVRRTSSQLVPKKAE